MIKYLNVDHCHWQLYTLCMLNLNLCDLYCIFGGFIFPNDFSKCTNVLFFATVSMTACNQNENHRLYIHDYISSDV